MKKKIGVFIDHDLTIRNFIFTNSFSELEKKYNLLYIFPDEKNRPGKRRRLTSGIFNKLKVKNKIFVKVDFKRHKYIRYFQIISNLYFSRYKSGLDKKTFIYCQERAINSRLKTLFFKILSIFPIYYFTSFIFKKCILRENFFLKEVLVNNLIDVIVHPTAWEGFFDSDLIDLGKKLKIPSFILMNSWDNTNLSGMTHGSPFKYLVWGKKAKIYANKYKKIPYKNIEVIGSAQFNYNDGSTINYKNLIGLKKNLDFILYAGSNMGLDETKQLEFLDNYIEKYNKKIKIVYRPHPWKQKAKNEKNIQKKNLKNVILDPFSIKNYNSLFNMKSAKGIISSKANESRIIIQSSIGVIGPIGTLSLESCWNKLPCCTFFPQGKEINNLHPFFKYWINLRHLQDFLSELKIPLIRNTEGLIEAIEFICKKKTDNKYKMSLYKKSLKYLDSRLIYKKKLFNSIDKIFN